MSEEFKEKLKSYENGLLKGEELDAFEEELAKLEQYHEYLEESNDHSAPQVNEKKKKRMMRRSKWKARIQTALTVLAIFILVMIGTSIVSAIYYSWGNPDRIDVLRNVVDHTLTVTDPYGHIGGTSANGKSFFRLEMTRDLNKQVGKEVMKVGDMTINYIFSLMAFPERNYTGNISQNQPAFTYPGTGDRGMTDWDRLENLPEGTVVSAYVSFNKLLGTSEVVQQFKGKDLDISWLAVDTGVEETDEWHTGVIFDPIGFPAYPIWHDEDMILDSYEEEKGFLFGKVVMEGHSSPDYEEGDSDILHTQFIKTLQFLERHEKKVKKIYGGWNLDLHERLAYIETNGINHYGIVITGPTKEVLNLKDEQLINSVEVDEVGFWNWWND